MCYYPDQETAFAEDEEIRQRHRILFSRNDALDCNFYEIRDFQGSPGDLKDIQQELKRREEEDDISSSVYTFDTIERVLDECPHDYDYIVVENAVD